MDDSTENGRIIRRSRTRKQASGIGSVCGCPGRRRRGARHDIRPDRRQDDGLRNRLRRKEDDRKPHRAVSRRKINRRDIKVPAMVLARDAVGRRPAAFVAGMSAIVRILVAETQHRTAGNGNERRHRHHHDGGESPRPSAETHCSHAVNYTTISVNALLRNCLFTARSTHHNGHWHDAEVAVSESKPAGCQKTSLNVAPSPGFDTTVTSPP